MKIAILTTDNREQWKRYNLPEPVFGTAPEALLQGFAMVDDVEVHVVSCVRKPVSSPERLARNVFFHSVIVPKIGWMTTGYQGCIRAVRRKLKEIQPDIVHGQGTERDCAIEAVFSGFPNVLTIHGNMRLIAEVTRPKRFSYGWLNARLEQFTIPRSAGVVCITNYTREATCDLAQRTWVVPNAVDASFFDVSGSTHAPSSADGKSVILCVGLVCGRKNQNALIRAIDPLKMTRNITVRFIGDARPGTPYADEFHTLLAARPWCEHLGWTNRDGLRGEFASADMLVLPSIEDNCPMVVLEAMAAGVPVVAPNVGGVPDLVEDGMTGLLCDPHNFESIRGAVAGMLDEPENAKQMAATAKERARVRFHPRVIAQKHLEVYREVLSIEA